MKAFPENLTLAAAQTLPEKGDVELNIHTHLRLARKAVIAGARLIHFPELSLTGYEPELASSLAFSDNDSRLDPLLDFSRQTSCILSTGAPLKSASGILIASLIIYPDGHTDIYHKHYLHPGEEKWFIPGQANPVIRLAGHKIASAICADINHPLHAANAALRSCTIYLPQVFITPGGYRADSLLLEQYARKYRMMILMANFGGPSGKYAAAGKSACWSPDGKMLASLPPAGEGLILAEYTGSQWQARSRPL